MKKIVFSLLLIPLFYFPCYISNDLLLKLTKEDGAYEYGGALLFLLTSIAFFILATNPKYYVAFKNTKKYPERKYFFLLTLVFFFACGEEISWGQRIFNIETPEAIKEINIQKEFNFHNLNIFHGITKEGEEKKGIMVFLTMHRLFYMTFLTYLLIFPILYSMNVKLKSFIDKIKLPVPNVLIGVLFALNLLYGNTLRAINNGLDGHGTVEIKEFVLALILFTLPLSWMSHKKT